MAQVWQQHWAFVPKATGQPVVIGELGGWYAGADKTWQDWAINYCIEHHVRMSLTIHSAPRTHMIHQTQGVPTDHS